MFTHGTRRLTSARKPIARAIVAVALPIVLLSGASDASAMSLVAAHAPGGPVHVAVAQSHDAQTETVSRSVGLMEGAHR